MQNWLFGENPGSAGCHPTRQLVGRSFRIGGRGRHDEQTRLETSAGAEHPQWTHTAMDPMDRAPATRDFLQTFGLSKNEDYLINPVVRSIKMGFGFKKSADSAASVALFDSQLVVVDTVWRRKLWSTCGSVTHLGDNMADSGEGDNEIVMVKLADLPLHVHYLLFAVCTFSHDVPYRQIHSAYVRMMHGRKKHANRELCHFSFAARSGSLMVVGVLTRKGSYWNFRALRIPATEETIQELFQNPKNLECLNNSPSYYPEMLHVTVNVIRGTGLAGKDASGCFMRRCRTDPYFIISFKRRFYTSEHRRRTSEPKWKSHPLEIGWINEADMKALKVQVFDRNAAGTDNSMGVIRIPGHALYRLGLGDHIFWFELEASKRRAQKQLAVSGKILMHFRIDARDFCLHPCIHLRSKSKETQLHALENMKSEHMSRALLDSGARAQVGIKKNEGKASVDHAALGRELLCAILPILEKNSVVQSTGQEQSSKDEIQGEVVNCSETLPGNTESQAMADTDGNDEGPSVSIQKEDHKTVADFDAILGRSGDSCSLEPDRHTDELTAAEHYQSTSDGEDSSSSGAGTWIPDEPYGSHGRVLRAVEALKQGQHFTDDYTIVQKNFARKPYLCLAQHKIGKKEVVVLKFYWEEAKLEHTIELHSEIASSENVCRIVQTLKTANTGHPPCLAFEKGTQTLRDWLRSDRSLIDRTWCLRQVLTGLVDLHARDIVHCDLKPSHVVFFPESVTWKLIDLDRAQKAGERRAVCFTAPYTAPEVLQCWLEEGELPVARLSMDIWSCGIVAYEVLTGYRMFGEDLTHDEICEFVLEGRVEEKLGLVENDSHHEAISNFLKLDPKERWSAVDALEHAAFKSDSQTTGTQA